MPFPETPRVVYERNPIREVICQLRFPVILEIGAQEPVAFQNQVRRGGYPLYRKEDPGDSLPPEIAGLLGEIPGSPFPSPGERTTHKFLSEDESRFISLAQGFVAVSEIRYQDWSAFRAEVQLAKGTLEAVYEPAFYSRIGLRYRNVIDRTVLGLSDEPWSDLLNETILGPVGDRNVGADVTAQKSEAVFSLTEVPDGLAKLMCSLERPKDGKEVFIIDTDFFTPRRKGGDEVLDVIDPFNHIAGNLFRWAISDRLRDALGRVRS